MLPDDAHLFTKQTIFVYFLAKGWNIFLLSKQTMKWLNADEQMNRWIDERLIDESMKGWIDKKMNRWIDE